MKPFVRLRSLPLVVALAGVLLMALIGPTRPPQLEAAGTWRVFLPAVHRANGSASSNPAAAFGYGFQAASLGNVNLIRNAGFGWLKSWLSWEKTEPSRGQYNWGDATNIVNAAASAGLKLLLRVERAPGWAATGSGVSRPPRDPQDFANFLATLVRRYPGKIAALELWNEPNLSSEWGNLPPDPGAYAALLRAAYPAIKAGDSSTLVVAAGMATTGGNGSTAMDDVQFIGGLYDAGARGFFDVLGSHPYGFAYPPEQDPSTLLSFRRAESQRALMVARGDAARPIWATEFGWLVDPGEEGHPEYLQDGSWYGRQWQIVSRQTQADYLKRAFQYAFANWPWMGVIVVFNLDFGADLYQGCPNFGGSQANQMRYYSVVYRANPCDPGNSPILYRPAYTTLQSLAKPLR